MTLKNWEKKIIQEQVESLKIQSSKAATKEIKRLNEMYGHNKWKI